MLMSANRPLGELENAAEFIARHIGIGEQDEAHMLSVIGAVFKLAQGAVGRHQHGDLRSEH